MEEKTRVHIFVSGRVQGVLFRAHAQKEARKFYVTGWAHNLIDGGVEMICEGEKENIVKFIEWCKKGSPPAKVENVEIQYQEHKGEFQRFEVRE
jgi:acylphosphatase